MEGCENRLLPSCLLRAVASQTLPARTPRGAQPPPARAGTRITEGRETAGKGKEEAALLPKRPQTQAPTSQLRPSARLCQRPRDKAAQGPGAPAVQRSPPRPLLTGPAAGGAGRPRAPRGAAAPEPGPPRAPPPSPPGGRASCPRPRAGSPLRSPAHRRPRRALGAAASTCAMARGRAGRSRRCPPSPRAPQVRKVRLPRPPASASRHTARPAGSPEPARLCHAPGPDPRPGPAPRPDPAPAPPRSPRPAPPPARLGSSPPVFALPLLSGCKYQDRGTNSDGPRTQAPVFRGSPQPNVPHKSRRRTLGPLPDGCPVPSLVGQRVEELGCSLRSPPCAPGHCPLDTHTAGHRPRPGHVCPDSAACSWPAACGRRVPGSPEALESRSVPLEDFSPPI